jgi:hypothetical protein
MRGPRFLTTAPASPSPAPPPRRESALNIDPPGSRTTSLGFTFCWTAVASSAPGGFAYSNHERRNIRPFSVLWMQCWRLRTLEEPMFFQTVPPLFAAGEVLLGLSSRCSLER